MHLHFGILSDPKKTTAVVERLSTTSSRCSVTEITSLLQDKILGLIIEDNHKVDIYNMDIIVGEEVIDAKIMITEMTIEIEGDKILEETLVMTDMTAEIE